MQNPYDELIAVLAEAKEDFRKHFEKGNAAAGTRVRKTMQSLKSKANEVRKAVNDNKSKPKE